jgi:hypothetical protein
MHVITRLRIYCFLLLLLLQIKGRKLSVTGKASLQIVLNTFAACWMLLITISYCRWWGYFIISRPEEQLIKLFC